MRTLLIIGLLICLAALAGWVTYSDNGETASIDLDKQEAREDTRETIDAVEDAIEDIQERFERRSEDKGETEVDIDVRDRGVEIDIQPDNIPQP